MNEKIYDELVELGIFESRIISEEAYQKCKETDEDGSAVYYETSYNNGGYSLDSNNSNDSNEEKNKWYKRIDTKGLSTEDVKLQLEIEQTKAINSIRKMVLFFVVITVIALVLALFVRIYVLNG